jgi:hypothetical protein
MTFRNANQFRVRPAADTHPRQIRRDAGLSVRTIQACRRDRVLRNDAPGATAPGGGLLIPDPIIPDPTVFRLRPHGAHSRHYYKYNSYRLRYRQDNLSKKDTP